MEEQLIGGLTAGQVVALVVGIAGIIVAAIHLPGWPATKYRVEGGALAIVIAVIIWLLTSG